MEYSCVESQEWNGVPTVEGAEDSMGHMGSVLQLPPDSWGTGSHPATLQWHWVAFDADVGHIGWLFLPAGHNPGALLGASTYCLGNTSHLVSCTLNNYFLLVDLSKAFLYITILPLLCKWLRHITRPKSTVQLSVTWPWSGIFLWCVMSEM